MASLIDGGDEPLGVRCRVTFLGVRAPVLSERRIVHVTVPHVSRADEVARKQADLWEEHWHVYSVVEEP